MLKLVFFKTNWVIWNQRLYERIRENGYDLNPFYAKVKFGHIGFCMGKTEIFFLETIAALDLKLLEKFN